MSGQIQTIVTPSGPLAVIRPVAERLLQEGVVSGTLDGSLHAADAATVKAALMAFGACDFCSAPGATHVYDVPDFGIGQLPGNMGAGKSTGGWGACDACKALIDADRRDALLDRAIGSHAFPKFSRHALRELLDKFWQGMDDRTTAAGVAAAALDFVDDKLPLPVDTADPELATRAKRIARIARLTGLTADQLDALRLGQISRDAVAKLAAFHRQYKGHRDMREMLARLGAPPPPLPQGHVPHWQVALDRRFEAMATLGQMLAGDIREEVAFPEATDLHDPAQVKAVALRAQQAVSIRHLGYGDDLKALRRAATYSFSAETAAAIEAAARSIPHDAPLTAIDPPNAGAGWFWFSEPLRVAASPVASSVTDALLWSWTEERGTLAMRFSAYIIDRSASGFTGRILPSAKWHWPAALSFHDMLAYTRESYREGYGPGGPYATASGTSGEEHTVEVVSRLSLFFAAACVWFKQRIVVAEPGHVERHARKRYVREHKLAEPPTVQVIALRKAMARERTAEDQAADEPKGRNWTCRWVVDGHARLQPVGPGRKERKLIWIMPFTKGPADKPLRTREKVFAVVR